MLINPDEVDGHFVKTMKDRILNVQVIMDFLTDVRYQAIQFEGRHVQTTGTSECYPFTSIPLLKALVQYHNLVESAATDPIIDMPSELDYMPGP